MSISLCDKIEINCNFNKWMAEAYSSWVGDIVDS